ncbi:MAG: hypothetical protein BA873_08695 [Desulfobulbaceae bacterium C00003063]|nr:MAG: hypothetical protein BA873_08695 [Desulfobulbaceae bacterium C00003063]
MQRCNAQVHFRAASNYLTVLPKNKVKIATPIANVYSKYDFHALRRSDNNKCCSEIVLPFLANNGDLEWPNEHRPVLKSPMRKEITKSPK